MIITRAPMRMSFVGGGTDLPDFYRRYPGRVLSTSIDKFLYLVINSSYRMDKVIVKYNKSEIVNHPSELEHDRFKAALLEFDITKGIEIATMSDVPSGTGLGSSSTFSVALMKGLAAFKGQAMSQLGAAEAACRLEIDILKEPIGKQDQYASAIGGLNIIQFNPDESVNIEPIFLHYSRVTNLENHILLFYTGISRAASSVLTEQKSKIEKNFETYKKMSDSVYDFKEKLVAGNIKAMAEILQEAWLRKKSLSSNVSNSIIDDLYETGIAAGAWGGKVLGAGGGGCLLFLAPPEVHQNIKEAFKLAAEQRGLNEFKEIRVKLSKGGIEVLLNN